MKKQTQQTPLSPCPKEPSAVKMMTILVSAVIGAILAGTGIRKATQFVIQEKNKNVTCHECDHVVARSSAYHKKRFKHAFWQDDKYTTLFFCKQHPPAWDYALGSDAEEFYFKTRQDRQVTRAGLEITNITWAGITFYWGTNETDTPRIVHNECRTNIGGTVSAKHVNH